eukprot:UN04478
MNRLKMKQYCIDSEDDSSSSDGWDWEEYQKFEVETKELVQKHLNQALRFAPDPATIHFEIYNHFNELDHLVKACKLQPDNEIYLWTYCKTWNYCYSRRDASLARRLVAINPTHVEYRKHLLLCIEEKSAERIEHLEVVVSLLGDACTEKDRKELACLYVQR